jgi:hypothetical protein
MPSRKLPGPRADATLFVGLARTLQAGFVPTFAKFAPQVCD